MSMENNKLDKSTRTSAPPGDAKEPARTVLVVEDDPALRTVLTRIVTAGGYQPEAVGNGEEALVALMTKPFDVILSDIQMPRMNGVDLLSAIPFSRHGRSGDPDDRHAHRGYRHRRHLARCTPVPGEAHVSRRAVEGAGESLSTAQPGESETRRAQAPWNGRPGGR